MVYLKGKLAEIIAQAIIGNTDFEKLGLNLDKEMDGFLGAKSSERIQRGPITSAVIHILRGLWAENLISLAVQLEQAARNIREDLTKGE